MTDFEFSSKQQETAPMKFRGLVFYNTYKDSEFLRNRDNIVTILSKEYELRHKLKKTELGDYVPVTGMNLEKNVPLNVWKTGPNIAIEDLQFTHNRLTGLTAAYAFENRWNFPVIKSSEATALGLIWDNCDEEKSRLYLSAVTGAEFFDDQFRFWPLICALRKLQLKKLPEKLVIKIAKIKNNDGIRMATVFKENIQDVMRLWMYFPGSSDTDLEVLQACASAELSSLFN